MQEALLQVANQAGDVLILLNDVITCLAKAVHEGSVQKTWLLQTAASILQGGTENIMCWEAVLQGQATCANPANTPQRPQL
jgi:hypothetical protein